MDLDNLPEPDELVNDIIENIEAGLASFRAVASELSEYLDYWFDSICTLKLYACQSC